MSSNDTEPETSEADGFKGWGLSVGWVTHDYHPESIIPTNGIRAGRVLRTNPAWREWYETTIGRDSNIAFTLIVDDGVPKRRFQARYSRKYDEQQFDATVSADEFLTGRPELEVLRDLQAWMAGKAAEKMGWPAPPPAPSGADT